MLRTLPLEKPSPDFETFKKVISGTKEAQRVHFAELLVDEEVMRAITEGFLQEKWIPENELLDKVFLSNPKAVEQYIRQRVRFFYRMGYDFVPDGFALAYFLRFFPRPRQAEDTATLSRGVRSWAEEGIGLIRSWEDFEKFPWEDIQPSEAELENYYTVMAKSLPYGMKVAIVHSLYEQVMETILGYEGLFFLIADNPSLVKEVIDRWGEMIYNFYQKTISLEIVGAIFHADDFGHKTSLIVSPEFLRQHIFPWLKKYASLAHSQGKMFWLHSCGNLSKIMDELIDDVKIDAFHSFQDEIIPVIEFKKRYGDKIGILGGVDMDKLCRLENKELRLYVRSILQECMPYRYALGSGNSIANYIPPENYLAMLEEGPNWFDKQ